MGFPRRTCLWQCLSVVRRLSRFPKPRSRCEILPEAPMATFVKRTEIPLEGARALPRAYFTSPAIFAEEIEKLFCRNWLCAGREARIAKAGDYFVVTAAEASVIVLRDKDGSVRAFHNLCRHRGTRLYETPEGRVSETIQC